jgi:hypothetical protein
LSHAEELSRRFGHGFGFILELSEPLDLSHWYKFCGPGRESLPAKRLPGPSKPSAPGPALPGFGVVNMVILHSKPSR